MASEQTAPVLLVHGIWDDGARFAPMRAALEASGFERVHAIDLSPNDGRASIATLAEQVDRAATDLVGPGPQRLDVVGFSMGALVSRYWLQRLEGKHRCRRFVSISGPHQGTAQAWWMPFFEGVRQMSPNSPLLADLAADEDPFGDVEVHCVWTPYDLMILPPSSSRLRAAHEHRLPIPMHRMMISHPRAIERVRTILAT